MAVGAISSDLRDAVRSLTRAPRFTAALVLTVAVGLGASVPLYSAADALLFRPPTALSSPSRLVEIYTSRFTGSTYGPSSFADYAAVAAASQSFAGLAAYEERPAGSVRMGGVSRTLEYARISGGFFDVLFQAARSHHSSCRSPRGRAAVDND